MPNILRALFGVDVAMDSTTKRALFCVALEALKDCINTGTNRLQVDAAGVTITADVLTVDIEAITGAAPNNKTLYDVHTKIDTLVGARDLKINAAWRLAVTTVSGTIANRGGAALQATTKQLMFIPHGAQTEYAHFNLSGTALTTGPQIPIGVAIPITKAVGDTMELIATAGTVYVTCLELVPRT